MSEDSDDVYFSALYDGCILSLTQFNPQNIRVSTLPVRYYIVVHVCYLKFGIIKAKTGINDRTSNSFLQMVLPMLLADMQIPA